MHERIRDGRQPWAATTLDVGFRRHVRGRPGTVAGFFYQELLGLEAIARDDDAALLVSPDGYQLYLRTRGERAPHFSGTIGIQYLIWTAESDEDLDRCERVLKAHSPRVTSTTADGFRVVEGRGPDGVPVVVTFPGPDQAPRHEIMKRIYVY